MISGTGPLGAGVEIILWVTALVMILGALFFTIRSFTARPEIRHFFSVSALIPLIAATLYMLMASGYGTLVQPGGHLFFYGRYIDWMFTTPLLLLDLALVALPKNFPGRIPLLWTIIAADVYMILTGLVASAIRGDIRWAFYGASCAGFLAVLYFIFGKLNLQAVRRGEQVNGTYRRVASILIVLWFCYPIVWALGGEGFGIISLFAETLLYAILDVCAKVGYGIVLLANPVALQHADQDPAPIDPDSAQLRPLGSVQ